MEEQTGSHLNWIDIVVIVLYFCVVISVGIWSSRRSKGGSMSGYFLASKNMNWVLVGSSLFASNIGSEHFIGIAGSGAASGIGFGGYEIKSIHSLLLLGWCFVPVYMSSGIYTMPEYLRERFGGQRIRVYLSFLTLLLYIFTKISADLYAGALFIQMALNKQSTEWLYISILILLAMAAIFTIAGGLTAVIWTDFVQTIIMLIGAFILMFLAFAKVGGYQNLIALYPKAMAKIRAKNGTCGVPPGDYMNLLRSPYPGESDIPWTGLMFGLSINSIWYWCTDQVIVQRTLASKNLLHAKAATIYVSYLKLLPLFIMVFPGMIARVLYPDRVGCADPDECMKVCGSSSGCSNIAYVELVINILPSGLTGMMMAVMMSAIMSSLTSIFNSASTIFTVDVWTQFRTQPSEKEKLIVGRVFVVVLVLISVIWIPVIQKSGNSNLFDYIMSILAFLSPPICAVFLLALFWQRTNEPGAFWGLMVGLLTGTSRFIMNCLYAPPKCWEDEDQRPWIIQRIVGDVHYLHFSIISFGVTLIVAISVSLATKPIPSECLHRMTYWTRKSKSVRKNIDEAEFQKVKYGFEMEAPEPSKCMKTLNTIFRLKEEPTDSEVSSTEPLEGVLSEEEEAEKQSNSLYEDPFWRRIVNINAIICLCISSFVWGYYA